MVNEALAHLLFRRSNVIGEHVAMRQGRNGFVPLEIIGIASNSKEFSLRETSQPLLYLAFLQDAAPETFTSFALRTAGSPATLIPGVKEVVATVDPRLSLHFSTLQANVDESLRLPRALGVLAICFGMLAVGLAAIGLYGVVAYTMTSRRSEIGVRIALGASPGSIVRMALGDIGRLLAMGLLPGALVALMVGRLIERFLYGVTPDDPLTLIAAMLLLTTVAAIAAALPARRASRLDSLIVLREE